MANTYSTDLESSSNQYWSIEYADQTNLDLSTTAFSIELWIKNISNDLSEIIESQPASGNFYQITWSNSGDHIEILCGSLSDTNAEEGARIGISGNNLNDGNWHHIAFTRDGVTQFKAYVDGNSVSVTELYTKYDADATTGAILKIGSGNNGYIDGKIDEVRIWNDERTATEIQDNYQKELTGTEANLVGYWKFNNDGTDSTSNNNDLTNNNGATFSTDASFMVKSIDLESSSSQYLSISDADQTGLDITQDLTFELWFNLESIPALDDKMYLLDKFATDDQAYTFFLRNESSGGKEIACYIFNTGQYTNPYEYFEWSYDYNINIWTHLAITVDRSNNDLATKAILYINGVSQGNPDYTAGTSFTSNIYNSSAPFAIGANNVNNTPEKFFDGKIDEVRVWNDIRTATEISDNYQTELTGSEANLVGYWRMNNNYVDSSFNGNALTPSDSLVFSTDVPFGGGYTLTMEIGAFTLTGNVLGLKRALILVMGIGAFTLTGIAIALKKGFNIILNTVSFLLTGKSLSFRTTAWKEDSKPSSSWTNDEK